MALDHAFRIKLLRSSVILLLGVTEEASLHVSFVSVRREVIYLILIWTSMSEDASTTPALSGRVISVETILLKLGMAPWGVCEQEPCLFCEPSAAARLEASSAQNEARSSREKADGRMASRISRSGVMFSGLRNRASDELFLGKNGLDLSSIFPQPSSAKRSISQNTRA
jgi:hypothetical protein